MATMTLNSYVYQLSKAWDECDGVRCGELLSIRDPHFNSGRLLDQVQEYDNCEQLVSNYQVQYPLSDLVSFHFKVMVSLCSDSRSFATAFQYQSILVSTFAKVLQSQSHENWGCRILEPICRDLRNIAILTARYEPMTQSSDDHAPTMMEKAADSLMALFRICAADTRTQEADTKRWGMLSLVNHLFIIYFRINRLHLCKPLIRAIEAQASLKERFPREQMVTYKYYVGKKAMFDSEFKTAEDCLEYAFRRASTLLNKRKILTYLIPVKMFLGILPSTEALKKYNLLQFKEVAESLRQGNVKRFYDSLKASEKEFISDGVYLILEKLQMMLYRNLFKKVSLLSDTHQLPIKMLECALRWSGYDEITTDETHCIVANLIYSGNIRGYISHQHQVLVVAKTNAFTAVNSQQGNPQD